MTLNWPILRPKERPKSPPEYLSTSGSMSYVALEKRLDIIFKMLCLLMDKDTEHLRKLVDEWQKNSDAEQR